MRPGDDSTRRHAIAELRAAALHYSIVEGAPYGTGWRERLETAELRLTDAAHTYCAVFGRSP